MLTIKIKASALSLAILFSFFLTYSYSEDCENLKQMSVNLYAKVLYALSPKTVFDWKKYLSLPVNAVMIINPVSEKR